MRIIQSFTMLITIFLVFFSICSSLDISVRANSTECVPGQIVLRLSAPVTIVKTSSGIVTFGVSELDAINKTCSVTDCMQIFQSDKLNDIYLLSFGSDRSPEAVAEKYRQSSHVVYAEPNYIAGIGSGRNTVPNDPDFGDQWGLHNTGQSGGTPDADIDAPEAWDIETGDSVVVIAILDTGIDLDHPDLAGKIVAGYDFVNGDNEAQDDNGHGTHVAGIAAAETNNGEGIAGVCWGCSLMPVKVLGADGNGNDAQISTGVEYAANHGANVINLSLGLVSYSQLFQDAIDYAHEMGCVIVASSGNNGSSNPFYPAAYENVLAVAAHDRNDIRCSFSGYGDWVDLCGPGMNILSTANNNTYLILSGTSMAAPFVSGSAGVLMSAHPDWSHFFVESQLLRTANSIDASNPYYAGLLGSGRVNAGSALSILPSPELSLESFQIEDPYPGDADGVLDPNETASLTVTIHNDWADTTGVTGSLSTSDPYITINHDCGTFGNIVSQQNVTNTLDAFNVTLADTCPYGHDVTFTLTVEDAHMNTWSLPFTMITGFVQYRVEDPITTPTIWTENATYLIENDLLVTSRLTIEPGVTIAFSPNRKIIVRNSGQIIANGNDSQRIIFTSITPPDTWNKISIEDSVTTVSEFTFCTFGYGSVVFDDTLTISHPTMTFQHNIVTNCGNTGNIDTLTDFTNNVFELTNISNIRMWGSSDHRVENNRFALNGGTCHIRIMDETTAGWEELVITENYFTNGSLQIHSDGIMDSNTVLFESNDVEAFNEVLAGRETGRNDGRASWNVFRNCLRGVHLFHEVDYNVFEECGIAVCSCANVHHNQISGCITGIETLEPWKESFPGRSVANPADEAGQSSVHFYRSVPVESDFSNSPKTTPTPVNPMQTPVYYEYNNLYRCQSDGIISNVPNASYYQRNNFIDNPATSFRSRSGNNLNVRFCYWGDITTTEMNQSGVWPDMGDVDIASIWDFYDDIEELGTVDYSYWLTSPQDDAPGFLWQILKDPPDVVGVQPMTLTLIFSRPMDTTTDPQVTFGINAPYESNVVLGSWQDDDRVWEGCFDVSHYTGNGLNTLKIWDARDPDGMEMPVDTSYTFTIDTGVGPVQGVTAAILESAIDITWQANYEPDLVGYVINYDSDASGPPYEGTGAAEGNSPIHVGKVTYTRLTGLSKGTTYYITLQAKGSDGKLGEMSYEVTATFSDSPTPTTPGCIHHGDVNGDLVVSSGDAQMAFYIALGIVIPTETEACSADCNGDGIVSSGDAQSIFLLALGSGVCEDDIPPTPTITPLPSNTPTPHPTNTPTPTQPPTHTPTMTPAVVSVVINELRIDQSDLDSDEYVELVGPPGRSLDRLSYIVLGDNNYSGSGVIEHITDLTDSVIPADGYFVLAQDTFTLSTADFVAELNFENDDNVTHMVVADFYGVLNQDLDRDNDGILDTQPWSMVMDAVGVIKSTISGDRYYGAALGFSDVGPQGLKAPWHILRCPDIIGDCVVGASDVLTHDWPGSENLCTMPLGCDTPGCLISIDNIIGNMRYIPPGTYIQGSISSEPGRDMDETQFTHSLSRHLAVMETELTRQMWLDLLPYQPITLPFDPSDTAVSPSFNHPLQQLTWYEAILYANFLSLQNGYIRCYYADPTFHTPIDSMNYTTGPFYCDFSASGYRLPTEGEWEYFCRAGTVSAFSCPESNYTTATYHVCTSGLLASLEQYGVFCANDPPNGTAVVGSKRANPWNVKDVHGSVWEWCWDWYGAYPSGSQTDYSGPISGPNRIWRGGAWNQTPDYCRSAYRYYYSGPGYRSRQLGVRLVRTIIAPGITPTPIPTITPSPTIGTPAPTDTPEPTTIPAGTLYAIDPIVGNMRYVPAGSFQQGSPAYEPCREISGGSETQFLHTLTRPIAVMETEITRRMWADLLAVQPDIGPDPSNYVISPSPYHPVQSLPWFDTLLFANILSIQNGRSPCYFIDAEFINPIDRTNFTIGPYFCDFSADGYRLPSEGEWEYFTRTGWTNPHCFKEPNYTSETCESCAGPFPTLNQYCVYCLSQYTPCSPVGSKLPNPWGIYDVYGNVYEWCWDWEGSYPGPSTDYTGPDTGTTRIVRGGGYSSSVYGCRSAFRWYRTPEAWRKDIGFRLVRTIVE